MISNTTSTLVACMIVQWLLWLSSKEVQTLVETARTDETACTVLALGGVVHQVGVLGGLVLLPQYTAPSHLQSRHPLLT